MVIVIVVVMLATKRLTNMRGEFKRTQTLRKAAGEETFLTQARNAWFDAAINHSRLFLSHYPPREGAAKKVSKGVASDGRKAFQSKKAKRATQTKTV